ncbi:glutamyl-tRNA(Gln) amidotransferase subunit A [Alicycliphilus denitrificans]|uniref:Asp-tRNA(Asn)/Glu-tRNA(Gln) amidotransferase subunit GatA n=1 Tax=Alicycliphilus denitrificans TaxID=179636 RepID=UPI00095DDAF0|nr:Asp-tRNA(Asn)/Glu-tRNA(Gln) amidotransferase subunit GatA [Alicycliphilus denitrificans]MBN9575339.1 Asp-tRNA(Asn)/Glu-tRNA(Gln) amidotransferase subunit GatA [Alicycliphilus denitrificans]OJW93114.1 MAG: aspartyl/glutamyl-tRNA amidotransferase subunit A [Alicycliphilus sp. 69-12]BCN37048.1 glutamyl-tRNA(Gln) amidotransferase subunit A [Alicycliphilus denitrificans]
MSSTALHDLGVAQLAAALRGGQVSAVEAARHFLARARSHQHLGAYVALNEDATLAQAREQDASIAAGTAAPLAGVPIAHKDIFVTRDFPTTAASRMLAGYRSPFDATVVARLAGAGCVTLGKLNCDEFAMGGTNENSAVAPVGFDAPQPVRNPWDGARVPGGSSGGSAAAVAARLAPAVTGTDTGGSIRQPASFCGVTGIKPTYGRASRYGMIAFASSLDQAGPMARSAEDCALLLSAMCGPDPDRDSTSLDRPAEDFGRALGDSLEGLRIGVPAEFFGEGLAADVHAAVDAALKEYEKLGARLVPITLPRTDLSVPVYYILAPAEASSNLSRFDGVRYGYRASQYSDLLDMYKKTRAQGFGDEVKRRIMIGTYVLSEGYYDAYYLQAQKLRRMIADDFQQAFKECDLIAGPVAPTTAWRLGSQNDPVANYLADIYTLPASLAGLPGMSVPAGFGEGGLPVGLQLIGNYFQEARLLNAAHRLQQATDFHLRAPEGI